MKKSIVSIQKMLAILLLGISFNGYLMAQKPPPNTGLTIQPTFEKPAFFNCKDPSPLKDPNPVQGQEIFLNLHKSILKLQRECNPDPHPLPAEDRPLSGFYMKILFDKPAGSTVPTNSYVFQVIQIKAKRNFCGNSPTDFAVYKVEYFDSIPAVDWHSYFTCCDIEVTWPVKLNTAIVTVPNTISLPPIPKGEYSLDASSRALHNYIVRNTIALATLQWSYTYRLDPCANPDSPNLQYCGHVHCLDISFRSRKVENGIEKLYPIKTIHHQSNN